MGTEITMPDPTYRTPRRWPRFKLNVPVRLIASKGNKVLIVQGRGNELNEGGMEIFGGIELAPGEKFTIEFTAPYSSQPVRVRASVCDRRGYTYGVAFLLEDDEDRENASQIHAVLSGLGSRI